MAHYLYHRPQPKRVGLRWTWRVGVRSQPGGDRIGEYSGMAWTRRGAVRATRTAITGDHRKRTTYEQAGG